jgi:homoserine kinase
MAEPVAEFSVPGSTSNLGPAFDALSVAVRLYLRVEVLEAGPGAPGTLDLVYAGERPRGENRLEAGFRLACERFGPAPGLRARVTSDIPMTAGLGSSAAAVIAGLKLYEIAAERPLSTGEVLGAATVIEGHPDNASAALLGGITLSCQCDSGDIIARAWTWPADIRFVVATPEFTLATKQARGVLPSTVPLKDAVANLQRALLLVRALETGRYDDIREALTDRWHQPARGPLVPGLAEAIAIDDPSVLGVCLSGAGPSVVALAAPGRSADAAARLGDIYRRLQVPHTIRDLAAHPVAHHGQPVAAA